VSLSVVKNLFGYLDVCETMCYFPCLVFELRLLVITYLWMMLCYACEPIAYL
jgi:hypothetical protein